MSMLTRPGLLSRRDFLRLGSLGLAGVLVDFRPLKVVHAQSESVQYGRILEPSIPLYNSPSLSSQVTKYVWKDLVLPIQRITVGDADPPHNRIWYQLGEEGYAHSGVVQPVRIELNQPAQSIPETGQLAEITVPYTDARRAPVESEQVAYRLYYGTTHWVTSIEVDPQNNSWYALFDDKLKTTYYAQSGHLRMIPDQELQPLSPSIPPDQKRIEVHLGNQAIIAYEYDHPVFMARTATGARFSTGNYETEPGRYFTNRKRPSRHMAAGDRAAPNSYDLPGVPWICYFTEDGISLHGTYWHNDFGKKRSHGCVNLPIAAARWFYLWTLPSVPASEQSIFETSGTILDVI